MFGIQTCVQEGRGRGKGVWGHFPFPLSFCPQTLRHAIQFLPSPPPKKKNHIALNMSTPLAFVGFGREGGGGEGYPPPAYLM